MSVAAVWLDDDIDEFVGSIAALRAKGIEIRRAATEQKAREYIASVNCYIVDLKLRGESDATAFIRDVVNNQPDAKIIIHSAYANTDDWRDFVAEMCQFSPTRVRNLPKLKQLGSAEFEKKFVDPIVDFLGANDNQKSDQKPRSSDPSMPFNQYTKLARAQKIELNDFVRKKNEECLQDCFARGAVWVMFLGSSNKPNLVVKESRNIPTYEELYEMGQKENSVPFHYYAETLVDDIDSGSCSKKTEAHGYPVLNLTISAQSLSVHFDTGCYVSRFDYEIALELALIDESREIPGSQDVFDRATGKRVRLNTVTFKADFDLYDPVSKGTDFVTIRGLAIDPWGKSGLARECFDDCKYYSEHERKSEGWPNCKFRKALIGRSILEDNDGLGIHLQHCKVKIDFPNSKADR